METELNGSRSTPRARWRSSATTDTDSDATAAGVGAGLVGVGVTVARAEAGGSLDVHSDGTVNADSLTVHAISNNKADSDGFALAGGLLAAGVNFASVDISALTQARLGANSHTTTVNDVVVAADATHHGLAEGHGLTVGGIAIGVMRVDATMGRDTKDAEVFEVIAGIDDNADVGARFVTLRADSNDTLLAEGVAAAGGLVVVDGTIVHVTTDNATLARVGAGADIDATTFNQFSD